VWGLFYITRPDRGKQKHGTLTVTNVSCRLKSGHATCLHNCFILCCRFLRAPLLSCPEVGPRVEQAYKFLLMLFLVRITCISIRSTTVSVSWTRWNNPICVIRVHIYLILHTRVRVCVCLCVEFVHILVATFVGVDQWIKPQMVLW